MLRSLLVFVREAGAGAAGQGALCRGLKQQVPVRWVRPAATPAWAASRAGDLEPAPRVPPHAMPAQYADSPHMENAPGAVRALFSVAHLGGRARNEVVRAQLEARVRRHQYDENTAETRVARLTARIRCLQDTLQHFPRNVKAKVTAQELVDKRKQLLKFLRQYDYRKFEWLLHTLNIEYKAHPDSWHQLSRKESLRRLTALHCERVVGARLHEHRARLHAQQGPFLRARLAALAHIRSEQHALQLPATVTQQQLDQAQQDIERWDQADQEKQHQRKHSRHIIAPDTQ